jgi:hypothetical protein
VVEIESDDTNEQGSTESLAPELRIQNMHVSMPFAIIVEKGAPTP